MKKDSMNVAILLCLFTCLALSAPGKKIHGGSGRIYPRNAKKRALENKKRAPENPHRLQSLFNI